MGAHEGEVGAQGPQAARVAALRQCGDDNRWSIDLEVDSGVLIADRIKVRQALRNLIANACDVQPEGGSVRVSATQHGGPWPLF